MAGTFTQKHVDGQLASSKATLLTVSGVAALVKTITLVNTSAGAVTVNLYFKAATSRRVIPKDYSLAAGGQLQVEMNGILENGNLIEGDASSATTVDYWISLVAES